MVTEIAPPGWPLVFVLVAHGYFAAISVILCLIDVRTHRLPNRIVLPVYPVALVLLTSACVAGAPWASLLRAVIGGAALLAFYTLLRVVSRRGMGGGDVKLAGIVGIYLGWAGWGSLVVGAVSAFVIGGLAGAMLIVTRRATRRTAIPFGPFLLAGAWIGILFGAPLSAAYLGI
ncbi:MAG: A24 family peptidase [Actinobacteria bacterium]|nr:A24 family peptidase [Actinomycetota bacterium]